MKSVCAALLCLAAMSTCAISRADDMPAMATPAAASIGIADSVESRIGSLRFFDGFPDSATMKATYDYLDFMRGVQLVLHAAPAVTQMALRDDLRRAGAGNGVLAIADAYGTPDESAPDAPATRVLGWLDLRKGPLVVEASSGTVVLSDSWGRPVAAEETGETDAAKLLVLPPGYKGKIAAGYRIAMPRTWGVSLEVRVPLADGDSKVAMEALRTSLRVYPLAQAAKPPKIRLVTLPATRPGATPVSPLKPFELIDRVVQEEPPEAIDAGAAALLVAIGIRKGQRLRPDGRMNALLAEAATVGGATVRVLRMASRESLPSEPVDNARVDPRNEGPVENIESRIGKFTFEGGMPTPDTTRLVYDHLDFMRGVDAYLSALGGAAIAAWQAGLGELGIADGTLGIFENAMDSRALVLTGDTEAVYTVGYLDLSGGPMVVESPPGMQGEVRTAWSQSLVSLGVTGPDKGKGGRYLLLPPGYTGEVPAGFRVLRASTYGNFIWWRGFRLRGDAEPAIDNARRNTRVYPLAQPRPVEGEFVNLSGRELSVLAADAGFYEKIAAVAQREPAHSPDPGVQGTLAALGIGKDMPFAPDDRLKNLLDEAAIVGDATARSIVFASRFTEVFPWPRSQWQASDVDATAASQPALALEARIRSAYYVKGFAVAMASRADAAGMQSTLVFRDAKGEGLDGGKNYRLRLPAKIPATRGWTLVPYDNQTRSMLQTDERYPGIGSQRSGLSKNKDGSIDIWFGPKSPAGKSANWVQTLPDKGWSLVLRLYNPTEAWYTKAWRPGEIEPVK